MTDAAPTARHGSMDHGTRDADRTLAIRRPASSMARSTRSGSINALASAPAVPTLAHFSYDMSDVDLGPVNVPLQHRPQLPAGHPFYVENDDSNSTASGASSRRFSTSDPNVSPGKRLRKTVSSAAALKAGRRRNDGGDVGQAPAGLEQSTSQLASRLVSGDRSKSRHRMEVEQQMVRHTTRLSQRRDEQGRWHINSYIKGREIGRGMHGVVYIGKYWQDHPVQRKSLDGVQGASEGIAEDIDDRSNETRSGETGEEGARYSLDELARESMSDPDVNDDSGDEFPTVAIKVVRREPRTKSLRRSQARREAEQQAAQSDSKLLKGQLLRDVDDRLKWEIAIMKRIHHDHIVRLYEVIDDINSKKVFMILEFMEGGPIQWQDSERHTPLLPVEQTRSTFRQVVLGLEYLHHQGITHRDIKPSNLLWAADRQTIKISDFGVSHLSTALNQTSNPLSPITEGATVRPPATTASDDRALRKTEGSPAFMAPELCCPFEATPRATPSEANAIDYFTQRSPVFLTASSSASSGNSSNANSRIISRPLPRNAFPRGERPLVGKAIDIWALGVTLYCLLFGRTPFDAPNEYELFNVIWNEAAVIPDTMGVERISTWFRDDPLKDGTRERDARILVDLLGRLLDKDPRRRIKMEEVKSHPWVLSSLERPRNWVAETALAASDAIQVSQYEVVHFVQPRSTTPTSSRPFVTARASLRKAMIKLGIKSPEEVAVDRIRSKSVSSASASACASPPNDTHTPSSLSRQTSRAGSVRYSGSRAGTRSPSPARQQGLLRKQNFLRNWHSKSTMPSSQRSSQSQLTADSLSQKLVSAALNTPSGSGVQRSKSGLHLHTPLSADRSSPISLPSSPSLNRVAFSDGEAKSGLLSRVRQRLRKRTAHRTSRTTGGAGLIIPLLGSGGEVPFDVGGIQINTRPPPSVTGTIRREDQTRSAPLHMTSARSVIDVFESSSDDDMDSISDDDDLDDDFVNAADGTVRRPLMMNNGHGWTTRTASTPFALPDRSHLLSPAQHMESTIASRRMSSNGSSSGEYESRMSQLAITTMMSPSAPASLRQTSVASLPELIPHQIHDARYEDDAGCLNCDEGGQREDFEFDREGIERHDEETSGDGGDGTLQIEVRPRRVRRPTVVTKSEGPSEDKESVVENNL